MNISTLIKKLEHLKEKHGDIDVVVQYRDDGGEYGGQDEEIYLTERNIFVWDDYNKHNIIKKAIIL